MDDFDELEKLSKAELQALGVKLTKRGKIDKRAYTSSENNIKKALEARKQIDKEKLNQKYQEDDIEPEDILIEEDEPEPEPPKLKKVVSQKEHLVEVKQKPKLKAKPRRQPEPESESESESEEEPAPRRKSKRSTAFESEISSLKQELMSLKMEQQQKELQKKAEEEGIRKIKVYRQIIPLLKS
jgi:hypothetical protein